MFEDSEEAGLKRKSMPNARISFETALQLSKKMLWRISEVEEPGEVRAIKIILDRKNPTYTAIEVFFTARMV